MAQVTVMVWNIQTLGPTKYAIRPNNFQLVNLIAAAVREAQADIFCLIELISGPAASIVWSIQNALPRLGQMPWDTFHIAARPQGDVESYAFFWRTDRNFEVITRTDGTPAAGLASNQFPNNFSMVNGRRAAYVVFRTTDTAQNFVVTAYHAPANNQAAAGPAALQAMPEIQMVDRLGAPANPELINARFLTGDYNLDPNIGANPAEFNALAAASNTVIGTMENTFLLKNNNLPDPPPLTADGYLSNNALDNILFTPSAGHGAGSATVMNTVDEVGTWRASVNRPAAAGRLSDSAAGFSTRSGDFPNSGATAQPLNTPFKSWVLTLNAVSDHLPVIATTVI